MAKEQIFISYYHGDADFAARLRARLHEEGWQTYSDVDLLPGDDYARVLSRELNESKYVVVVISYDTLHSVNVRREFDEGLRREQEGSAKVIPLLISPCPDDELSEFIGTKHYADFVGDFESGFRELLSALPGGADKRKPAPANKGGSRNLMSAGTIRIILALIPVVGAVLVGYWQWVYRPAHADKPANPGYYGRILNMETGRAMPSVKVYVEGKGVPATNYSDSDGVFPINADRSLGAVHIRVDAPNCKPFDGNVQLPERGVVDVRLQCPEEKPAAAAQGQPSTGFTYDHNPTVDEVRSNIQTVRKVSITYRDRRCEQTARKAVVRLNGAQLNGVDAKDILENGARPRTDIQFSVNIRQDGASYEIVCAR